MMTSSGSLRIFLCLLILRSFSTVLSVMHCDSDEYGCATTNKCIDSDYVCDGDNDCEDWSDETAGLCSLGEEITLLHTTISSPCDIDQFDCTDKCISRNWICDGDYDCDNGLDESPILCSQRTTTYTWASPSQTPQSHTTTTAHIEFRSSPKTSAYQTVPSNPTTEESYYNIRYRTFPHNPITTYSITPDYFWLHYSPRTSTDQAVTSYPKTAENQSTSNKEANQDTLTTSKNALENCDTPAETGSVFSLLNWTECVIFAVALIVVVAIVTFICLKRRRYIATLNPNRREGQRQVVSYLNSSDSPECQLVLVGRPVNVQPAVLQSNDHHLGQPPPYNTQPTTSQLSANEPAIHNSSKGQEYLV